MAPTKILKNNDTLDNNTTNTLLFEDDDLIKQNNNNINNNNNNNSGTAVGGIHNIVKKISSATTVSSSSSPTTTSSTKKRGGNANGKKQTNNTNNNKDTTKMMATEFPPTTRRMATSPPESPPSLVLNTKKKKKSSSPSSSSSSSPKESSPTGSPLFKDDDESSSSSSSSSVVEEEKKLGKEEWKPYIEIPTSKLYKRPFTVSKSYLDMPDRPGESPSIHKLLHKNRIVILTLFLAYIILDKPYQFVKDIDVFWEIFLNPISLLPSVVFMHFFSFVLPLIHFVSDREKIKLTKRGKGTGGSRTLFWNRPKIVTSYLLVQALTLFVSFQYVFFKLNAPIGTALFLVLECIVIVWKSHSYFICTNYQLLHNHLDNSNIQSNTLLWYFKNFYHFLLSPTLIYDQFSELLNINDKLRKSVPDRIKSILLELYTSFALLGLIHYLHMECIFPYMYEPASITSFLKMMIPAEFNFQIQYYLLYHCVFSLLADLSGFEDRLSFYDDYWNACTTKDILQKWSKPVHAWLFRHVHNDLRSLFGVSRMTGLFFTVLFSGLCHEFVVYITSKNMCIPWSTMNLFGCAVLISFEITIKGLSESKIYRALLRVLLVVGHAAFYYAIYHLCFSTQSFTF
ncbi:membrane bound O-acyl transferase family protein [Cavenderia fasciculata]|uniref:Membrane bound O-acyl transferase family protein n=1 Tax=Cavenderia fasciculata TaxID=261658 RepID=F4PKJ4_CACFS|nr:membrane bound O-acyl transferase family protein [Cavenderia fasciculata]EGG24118.1 membrane bound O-acyl transferase family protein [Cavenderia fasciculata]|eukprot:XP_004361969.1 membrane bound O-acyl transferase family protein [Cavenderia fasciculata]